MDDSNNPDIIRLRRPVIDKRPDGIYLYFHPLPPVLIKRNPISSGDWPCDPDDWPIDD